MAEAKGFGTGLGIEIDGLRETERALRALEPTLAKEMDKKIRDILTSVSSRARSHIPGEPPLSNWSSGPVWGGRLAWSGAARAGVKIRKGGRRNRRTGFAVRWRLTNDSAAGAVFEVAGRRASGSTPQGRAFIRNLTRRFGSASRGIWRAWDEVGGDRVTREIEQVVRRTEAELQARLNAAAGGSVR